MGGKVIEYLIKAKDLTAKAVNSAKDRFKGFASSVAGKAKTILKNLQNIYAGLKMLSEGFKMVAGVFTKAVKEAFNFESMNVQFEVLFKSADKAKERLSDLSYMAAHTPFTLKQLAKASRQLHVFSDGALGGTDSLKLIGDTAAATGADVNELAFWVGRAYSMIAGGKPFGEAAMRLQELGVLTPEVRQEMEDLQASGADVTEVWMALEKRMGSFNGGMQKLSETGEGLMSTMSDNWDAVVRNFGNAFTDVSKEGIKGLSDAMVKLVEDGTIERWAENVAKALTGVIGFFRKISDMVGAVHDKLMEWRKWWARNVNSKEIHEEGYWEQEDALVAEIQDRNKANQENLKAIKKELEAQKAAAKEAASTKQKLDKLREANQLISAKRVAAEEAKQAKATEKKFKKVKGDFFKFLDKSIGRIQKIHEKSKKEREKAARDQEKAKDRAEKKKRDDELKGLRKDEKKLEGQREAIEERQKGYKSKAGERVNDFRARMQQEREDKEQEDKDQRKAKRRLAQLRAKQERLRKGRGKLGGKMSKKDFEELQDLEAFFKEKDKRSEEAKQLEKIDQKMKALNDQIDQALTVR